MAWFDTHDVGDFLDEFDVIDSGDVQVEPNLSQGITVRLTADLLNNLRKRAKSMGIGPSTLARMWIIERLRDDKENSLKKHP